MKKSFDLLNSDYETLKNFFIKKKKLSIFLKKKILVVKNEKAICNNSKKLFVNKPEYGAGSENIHLINEDSKKKNLLSKNIIQALREVFLCYVKKKKWFS